MNVLFYVVVHFVTNAIVALVKALGGAKPDDKKD